LETGALLTGFTPERCISKIQLVKQSQQLDGGHASFGSSAWKLAGGWLDLSLSVFFGHQCSSLNKVNKPVDRNEWGMTPQTVNAYYDPTSNEIAFPAAILQVGCLAMMTT
jgi:hypothetical protein